MTTTYEGWKNYQTWNVALWINNDYPLYQMAVRFMAKHGNAPRPYMGFVEYAGLTNDRTPDKIKFVSKTLAIKELNDMMRDFLPEGR